MSRIKPTKRHLLSKRAKVMKFLKTEGYTYADIGEMFNIDRSTVLRILQAEEKYKKIIKEKLKD
jgi:DNA-directed RNA polymerase specialized sigma24 family protein